MTREALDAEAHAFLYDESRLERFRGGLVSGNRRTIDQATIWSAFAGAYSDLPPGPERRTWLLAVLEELGERHAIQLPVRHGRQWDRSSEIALPTSVRLIVDSPNGDQRNAWRQFPWHPSLQWVLTFRTLGPDQAAFLRRVNAGLVEGWFLQRECFKYRSLQLTGDEKRLEHLVRGALFGLDRLTLDVLGCEPEALPLATESFGCGPRLLVFENAAPFMLARSIVRAGPPPRTERLAYGAGKQVLKAVAYLSMLEPPIEEVLYVGDLDAEGLKIAAELQRSSRSVVVRPADQFHSAMLESAAMFGSPQGWPVKDEQPLRVSESVLSFLASDVRPNVRAIVEQGRRIPEEVLSQAAMCRLLRETLTW
jgi:hypothetical protein